MSLLSGFGRGFYNRLNAQKEEERKSEAERRKAYADYLSGIMGNPATKDDVRNKIADELFKLANAPADKPFKQNPKTLVSESLFSPDELKRYTGQKEAKTAKDEARLLAKEGSVERLLGGAMSKLMPLEGEDAETGAGPVSGNIPPHVDGAEDAMSTPEGYMQAIPGPPPLMIAPPPDRSTPAAPPVMLAPPDTSASGRMGMTPTQRYGISRGEFDRVEAQGGEANPLRGMDLNPAQAAQSSAPVPIESGPFHTEDEMLAKAERQRAMANQIITPIDLPELGLRAGEALDARSIPLIREASDARSAKQLQEQKLAQDKELKLAQLTAERDRYLAEIRAKIELGQMNAELRRSLQASADRTDILIAATAAGRAADIKAMALATKPLSQDQEKFVTQRVTMTSALDTALKLLNTDPSVKDVVGAIEGSNFVQSANSKFRTLTPGQATFLKILNGFTADQIHELYGAALTSTETQFAEGWMSNAKISVGNLRQRLEQDRRKMLEETRVRTAVMPKWARTHVRDGFSAAGFDWVEVDPQGLVQMGDEVETPVTDAGTPIITPPPGSPTPAPAPAPAKPKKGAAAAPPAPGAGLTVVPAK